MRSAVALLIVLGLTGLMNCETTINCPYGCHKCSEDRQTCIECFNNYFLATTGKCEACLENCSSCTSSKSCLECKFWFYLDQTKSKCLPCEVEHCFVCTRSQECKYCNVGYKLVETPEKNGSMRYECVYVVESVKAWIWWLVSLFALCGVGFIIIIVIAIVYAVRKNKYEEAEAMRKRLERERKAAETPGSARENKQEIYGEDLGAKERINLKFEGEKEGSSISKIRGRDDTDEEVEKDDEGL